MFDSPFLVKEYRQRNSLHLHVEFVMYHIIILFNLYAYFCLGSFFLPRDQQRVPPARQTNYEGLAYLGEYPLAWAACCANEAVYNLLLDSGADPDAQDSFGNMILHMVVVCDKLVGSLGNYYIFFFSIISLSP